MHTVKYILHKAFTNRKINIVVIELIGIMADTTISVSKKFHDWLKSKGKKGESYEDIIKNMLKPEFAQELGGPDVPEAKDPGKAESDDSEELF